MPLYDKTLQTVLGERPCRVIVVSDPTDKPPAIPGAGAGGGGAVSGERVYRGAVRAFSLAFVAIGLLVLVVTLANGGGPALGRLPDGDRLPRRRRRPPLGRREDGAMSDGAAASAAPADGAGPRGRGAAARSRSSKRGLGVPWLFAAAYSAVGFSIYFALGVVADRGLGLTPLIFLAAGLLFGLTTLTYVEGGAMFRERGGSSTFARHAFNELIAFIAGWAILIDYLIVIALAAISVPHYLEPISGGFADPGWEIGDRRGGDRRASASSTSSTSPAASGRRSLAFLALADLGLQLAVIVVGALVVMHPDRLTEQLDLFTDPELQGHRLRGGGGDARLRRDRGRLRPRARHRRRAAAT